MKKKLALDVPPPREGEQEPALGVLIERTLPALRAFVARRLDRSTASKESVSDLVQSACREVIQNFEGFEYEGELPFRAYLYRTALNKVIDKRRYYHAEKRGANRDIALQELSDNDAAGQASEACDGPPERLLHQEEIDLLENAWGQLPEELREILTLRRIWGLSNRRAAERLGTTRARARRLFGRALARLTALYDTEGTGRVDE